MSLGIELVASLTGLLLGLVGFLSLLVLAGMGAFFVAYNGLVRARNRTQEAWAQINVQLKRRYDLIPNLLDTVRGYLRHEQALLDSLSAARHDLQGSDPSAVAVADAALSEGLRRLWAVADQTPELKAQDAFVELQRELARTEDAVAYARQGYNDAVLRYNNGTQMMPGVLIAGPFGFRKKTYFEAKATEREVVEVGELG